MRVTELELPGVKLVEPDVYVDDRGYFLETFRAERYARDVGIDESFSQDSLSLSRQGALRGLHLQMPRCQGKLVFVLQGEVYDVAVDVRRGSPDFGRWVGLTLSAERKNQLWIPAGFAHGFVVTSRQALFAYKSTAPYDPAGQVAIRWDDPEIGIDWPVEDPLLSAKDAAAPTLRDLAPSLLPAYA